MTVEVYNNVMSLIQKLSSLYNKILLNEEKWKGSTYKVQKSMSRCILQFCSSLLVKTQSRCDILEHFSTQTLCFLPIICDILLQPLTCVCCVWGEN